MKKTIAFIFTLVIILLLSACGDTSSDTNQDNQGSGQQQEQQSDSTQQDQGSQSQNTTTGQEQEQQSDTPEENRDVVLFNEFIAEYARVNPGRVQGISNGVAYWRAAGSRDFLLHDMNTGQTYTLDTDLNTGGNIVHWNGYIFVAVVCPDTYTHSIARFNMQGNFVDEYSVDERSIFTFQIQGGNIFVWGSYHGSNARFLEVISARDFSVVQSPLTLIRDVGHGRTEEVTDGLGHILLGYGRVFFSAGRDWHVVDLSTGESGQADYVVSGGNTGLVFGIFFVVDGGAVTPKIINTETGESFVLNGRFNNNFTGTNFHQIIGHSVLHRFNQYTTEFEVVFQPPNNNTSFAVLNDEYFVLTDHVGTFLYRFVDGDVNGEFVREIILP